MAALILGRFLEISLATRDITASIQFYERLGFTQLTTGDAWPHPYGVVSDGRVQIGLHQRELPSPTLSFVLPDLIHSHKALEAAGIQPEHTLFDEDHLHQVHLRDPGGHAVALLEARTYSPADPGSTPESLCGYFTHLSLPERDFERAREFWERAGCVAMPEEDAPYAHLPVISDQLDLALHRPRTFAAPMLVFECTDLPERLGRMRALDVTLSDELPRGVEHGAMLEAPEGTLLLVLQA